MQTLEDHGYSHGLARYLTLSRLLHVFHVFRIEIGKSQVDEMPVTP